MEFQRPQREMHVIICQQVRPNWMNCARLKIANSNICCPTASWNPCFTYQLFNEKYIFTYYHYSLFYKCSRVIFKQISDVSIWIKFIDPSIFGSLIWSLNPIYWVDVLCQLCLQLTFIRLHVLLTIILLHSLNKFAVFFHQNLLLEHYFTKVYSNCYFWFLSNIPTPKISSTKSTFVHATLIL